MKKSFTWIVLGLTILAVLTWVLPRTISYYERKAMHIEKAQQNARQEINDVVADLNRHKDELEKLVKENILRLEAEKVTTTQLQQLLKNAYNKIPDLLEVGAAFVPTGRKEALNAPHYGRINGETKHFQVEKVYDYTEKDWYTRTMEHGGNWIEAYYGKATKTMVTGYAAPFYTATPNGKKKLAGVFRANISLEKVNQMLLDHNLGRTGYGFLVSASGIILAHPQAELVNGKTRLTDILTKPDKWLQELLEDLFPSNGIRKGPGRGIHNLVSVKTGRKAWFIYEVMPSTGWTLMSVVNKDEFLGEYKEEYLEYRAENLSGWLLFCLLAVMLAGGLLAERRQNASSSGHHRTSYEWWVSIICSLILAIGISFLWGIFGSGRRGESNTILLDNAAIATVLAQLKKDASKSGLPAPPAIPTGVSLQSLEFSSANNVTMSGYIWQKYKLPEHKGITQAVILPESVDGAPEERLRKPFRAPNGKSGIGKEIETELVCWYFESVLRQPFEYRYYPFDHKDVWLRIWSADIGKPVLLIPDLESYPIIDPTELPGIETPSEFVLNGWKMINSHFEYKTLQYTNTLGMRHAAGRPKIPELYFVINLERNFIDAFITNLVPLLVVLFMLLATMITVSHKEKKIGKFGSNPFAILGACSALFFVILLSHIQLREQFAVPHIIYLEYFYFVMYAAVLWVTVFSFLIVSDLHIPFIQYKDGLLPKVLFLPIILITLYMITLGVFY